MVGEKKNSEGQRSPSCFRQPLSRLAATAPAQKAGGITLRLLSYLTCFGVLLFLYAFPYAAAYHYGPGLVVADIEAHAVGNIAVA